MNDRYAEICRYLGYRTEQPDEQVKEIILDCMDELEQHATPRSIYKWEACKREEDTIYIEEKPFVSRNLAKHLQGCEQVILFAATIGISIDRLIQRVSQIDMGRAVVLQACAAAQIEAYCDQCQAELSEQAREKELYLRPRFSPGYGDLSISYQQTLLTWLDCSKRIGLTLTDGYMLVPTKSVTALIGVTREQQSCHIHKCSQCNQTDCAFRRT